MLYSRFAIFAAAFLSTVHVTIAGSTGGSMNWAPVAGPAADAGAERRRAFSDAEYVSTAKAEHTETPVYPFEAARDHVGGVVRVMALVDEKGYVTKTEVMAVDPSGVFDDATVAALRRWRFKKEKRDGKPIQFVIDYVFVFRPDAQAEDIRDFKPDVLYFEDSADGRSGAEETQRLFGGRQPTVIAKGKIPPMKHPEVLEQEPPNLPEPLRHNLSGATTVFVDYIVGENGNVLYAVVNGRTDPRVREIAVDAVRKWRFKPAQREGKNVRCHLRVPIVFN